jgi:hypothetical protein
VGGYILTAIEYDIGEKSLVAPENPCAGQRWQLHDVKMMGLWFVCNSEVLSINPAPKYAGLIKKDPMADTRLDQGPA